MKNYKQVLKTKVVGENIHIFFIYIIEVNRETKAYPCLGTDTQEIGSTENPQWRSISRNVCKIRNGQITIVDTLFDSVC